MIASAVAALRGYRKLAACGTVFGAGLLGARQMVPAGPKLPVREIARDCRDVCDGRFGWIGRDRFDFTNPKWSGVIPKGIRVFPTDHGAVGWSQVIYRILKQADRPVAPPYGGSRGPLSLSTDWQSTVGRTRPLPLRYSDLPSDDHEGRESFQGADDEIFEQLMGQPRVKRVGEEGGMTKEQYNALLERAGIEGGIVLAAAHSSGHPGDHVQNGIEAIGSGCPPLPNVTLILFQDCEINEANVAAMRRFLLGS